MKESTEKRLFQYAMRFKKGILLGIFFLMIATVLELAGPFIAKVIIDNHVLSIEGTWEETNPHAPKAVQYDGHYYVKGDGGKKEEGMVTVFAVGKTYYIAEGAVSLKGKREKTDAGVRIGEEEIAASSLSLKELSAFFHPEQKPIILWLALYIGLLLIAGVFQFFQTFLLQKSSNQIVQQMRNDVFQHTQKIPINYFVDQPAGKIVARITNDTEAIRDLYERVLSIVTTRIIYMAGILIAIFILEPKAGYMCLIVIPAIYIIARIYKHFGSKYNRIIRRANSEINGNINESIQGMPVIQAFQVEDKMTADFEALNEEIYTYQRKNVRLSALTSFNIVNVIRNLTFTMFIVYFAGISLQGTGLVTIGVLYALVDFITRFFEPVTAIVNQFPLIEQARASGDRMFALMNEPGEAVKNERIPRYSGAIEFDEVTFAYDDENDVLTSISFIVAPGETAAFVGHTGSGKSSIMNVLFRFYDPQHGEIRIDGQATQNWSRQQVRSHMGIVLQDPFLFSGTIVSNVTMQDPRISREEAVRALQAVGADRFIEKLPNGYDEKVTEGGSTFSLGERQLISFARALAFNPAILILDEATANIDTETELIIQTALEVLKKGRTTLVIAHRLSTIQNADKIFVLEAGKIEEQGNHVALIQKQGIYYDMYQMQKDQRSHAG